MADTPPCKWCTNRDPQENVEQFIDCEECGIIWLCYECRIQHLTLIMEKRNKRS